jgi:5-methyltetrahydropteroyltriglutamate--homocysteine methyltransferase
LFSILSPPFLQNKRLGAGVIDGRSVWADDGTALRLVAALRAHLGHDQAISVQSSTSLQHVPVDLSLETNLPKDLISRLSFAVQKLTELTHVVQEISTLEGGATKSFVEPLDLATYTGAPATATPSAGHFAPEMFNRSENYLTRRAKQPAFPAFPTTTIGSFPQTAAIRRARLQFKKGIISAEEYKERMAAEIGYAVGIQDALGLDVLVHGEPERTDMVEVFGVKLDGFVFTEYGWVQSYGSRYVRPPIISGDITRPEAMTVHEFKIAQAVTAKPVKGMLTGPVTILNWSFPRKDILRSTQAFQIALALRQEVADLEAAGCVILQVDEPALREGLPLKPSRWDSYLDWATAAFRLATSVASPRVQVVTHLCYSQFEDIMKAIDDLQADVLTIENSRSSNEMVIALAEYGYSRDLGPGVYDVHSPVVPTVEFMAEKLRSFLKTGILGGDATRIHVNPDCGLKTRRWEEVVPALKNMVEAARQVRAEISGGVGGGTEKVDAPQAAAAATNGGGSGHNGCDCHH